MEKITKKQNYEMLLDIVSNSDVELKGEMVEFINKEIATIDARAEKAKERAAAKREAGDELREAVKAVLTSDLQTADAILVQLDGEELTKQKVIARLTQLVNAGVATKEDVKTEDNKTVKAYKLV